MSYVNRPPRGQQRDKIYREALRLELADMSEGVDLKKLREIARAHIEKAAAGDMQAIKELADRLDGKPGQLLEHSVPDREPLTKIVREIVHVNRLTDLPGIVPGLDLEVALKQLNDREIGSRLAVGDRGGFEDKPVPAPVRVAELPDEARLAHSGLPEHRNDLALPIPRAFHGLADELDLGMTADEASETSSRGRLQARADSACAGKLVDLRRPG